MGESAAHRELADALDRLERLRCFDSSDPNVTRDLVIHWSWGSSLPGHDAIRTAISAAARRRFAELHADAIAEAERDVTAKRQALAAAIAA